MTAVQEDLKQQAAALKEQQEELEITKREILALNREIALQKKNLASMVAEAEAKAGFAGPKNCVAGGSGGANQGTTGGY